MHKTFRVLLLVAILGLFVVSASAQTGGILIGTNFGGDPTTINIRCSPTIRSISH